MYRISFPKRVASTVAVGGILLLSQLGGPSAVGATGSITKTATGCGYAASIVTSTDLTLARPSVAAGEGNTARVRVSSGAAVPKGTVRLHVSGHAPTTVTLSGGTASMAMPVDLRAGRTHSVTAHYNGQGCYRPSSDATSVTVESGGGQAPPAGPPNTSNVVLGVEAAGGVLPGAGADEHAGIFALVGATLLGAGGVTLVVFARRRKQP